MGSEGAPPLHPYLPLAAAPLGPSRHRVLRSPTHLGIIGAASDTPDSVLSLKDGSILYCADPSFRAYEIEGRPNASISYTLPIPSVRNLKLPRAAVNISQCFELEGTVTILVANTVLQPTSWFGLEHRSTTQAQLCFIAMHGLESSIARVRLD
ncbi:hypothetical protein B0H15DRAFT_807563 [Mycena belliarum]|uniref:Uncharacterized protein n=1 Tax=Mycena belliarum TaxID=1033014 RepID=A0AAD6XFS3_9AGAR|nr:hypothetical protein B0H15DRAFT_807563 [Mycena belliae]